jgi:predicted permease
MGFVMLPLREQLIGGDADDTWILLAAAALLLGLSCANVTNLLLARGARRTREIAVRAAIGASRSRQIRELIGESLIYAASGTALGLAIAGVASDVVMTLVPLPLREQLGLGETTFDWRVAVFAASVMALTTLVAGLAPARRLAQTNALETLRQSGRGVTGPRALMQMLVIGEVAFASLLLLAAGVMATNLSRLMSADLGLATEQLSAVEITLPPSRYGDGTSRLAVSRVLLEAARSAAGVERAGFVTTNPLDRGSYGAGIETEERPLAPGEAALVVNHRLVSEGWFETAGIPLVQGRVFDARDDERSAPVAIVSRRMAARLWPGANPIGRRIRMARPNMPWLKVVGVVADLRDYGEWRDTWYLPYAQHADTFAAGTVHLMLRTPLDARALAQGLRDAVRQVDSALPIPVPTPMTAFWSASLEPARLAASASTLFGLSGLLLAVIGTYSVLAYAVAARTRELGIRVALGATRSTVLRDVLGRGAALAGAGLFVGVLAGVAANRVLSSVAAETPGLTLTLIAGVMLTIGASSVAASAVPACRAMRIDPVDVMRAE